MEKVAAGDDDEIRVRATLIDAFSAPEKIVERSAKNLGNEMLKTAAKAEALDKALDDVGDEALETAGEFDAAAAAIGRHRKSMDDDTAAQRRWNMEANKTTVNMGKIFKLSKMLRLLTKGAIIGSVLDGLTALVTVINGVAAAAAGAVAGLSPLVGMFGALPGLLASGVQGMVTFKIATKGVGDALKNMGDLQKFNESLKNLSPNAAKFAKEVRSLRGPWKDLQQNVQNSFFKGFDREVRRLSDRYLPILNSQLTGTSRILNEAARGGSRWLASSGGSGLIDRIMTNNNSNLPFLLSTAGNLFKTTLNFMDAADVLTSRVSKGLDGWSERMNFIVKSNKGGLRDWLSGVYDRWIGVKDATWDYFMGFYGLMKGASPMVDFLGESLSKIGQDFNDWANSAAGQEKIKQWFTDMIPVVEETGLFIRDLAKAWADIAMDPDKLVPLIQSLRTELLPALVDIFNSVEGKFLPAIIDIVEAIAKLADAGALDGISIALGAFADAMGALASVVDTFNLGKLVSIVGALMLLKGGAGLLLGGKGGKGAAGAGLGGLLMGGGRGGAAAGGKHAKRGKVGTALGKAKGAGGGTLSKLGYAGAGLSALDLLTTDQGKITNEQRAMLMGTAVMTGNPYIIGGAAAFAGMSYLQPDPKDLAQNQKVNKARQAATAKQRYEFNSSPLRDHPMLTNNRGLALPNNQTFTSTAPTLSQKFSGMGRGKDLGSALNAGRAMNDVGQLNQKLIDTATNAERARTSLEGMDRSVKTQRFGDPTGKNLAAFNRDRTPKAVKNVTPKGTTTTNTVQTKVSGGGSLAAVTANIRALDRATANPKVKVEPGRSQSVIDNLRATLARIRDKNVNVNVTATGISRTQAQLAAINKERWTGGSVVPGTTYSVNELGPEAFVGRSGKVSMMTGGPHMRQFGEPGQVIPASVTSNPNSENTGAAAKWAVDAFRESVGGVPMGGGIKGQTITTEQGDHFHYHHHGGSQAQGQDTYRQMKRAVRDLERERRERK